jgi:hypothetical protein
MHCIFPCRLSCTRKKVRLISSVVSKGLVQTTILILILMTTIPVVAQHLPASPDRPWHSSDERQLAKDGKRFGQRTFPIDADKTYSLADLIDLAEAHNPDTRVAWENARAGRSPRNRT